MPDTQQSDVTTVNLKDGTTLHLKGANLPADQVAQKVSAFRASQSSPPASSGAGGSWEPTRPTFFRGMEESAGIPSWESTKSFLSSAYHHPADTAEDTWKTANAVTKFAAQNPGKFLWAMTNVPQIKESYNSGNYAETAGLLVGTLGQGALTFFTGEGVIPESVRGFKAGLAGKTAEQFASSERALKAARTAERVDKMSKLADSVRLTITPGERLQGGKLEALESSLRGFPGLGGTYRKVANQRRDAILALHDSLGGEANAIHDSAQNLYGAIEQRVPAFAPIQREISDLRKAQRNARDPQVAYDIGQKLSEAQQKANDIVEKSGDPIAVSSWRHADSLWRRYHAKVDLQDTIEGNVVGSIAEKLAKTGTTEEAARRPVVQSLTHDLEQLKRDGTLDSALGKQRSEQLLRVASLYDRVRQSNHGYIAERILGYAVIGTLPFIPKTLPFLKGYVFDVAAGAAAGMAVSWAMMKFGSTEANLEGFLRAAETGDMRRAQLYAQALAKAAQADAQAAAAKPKVVPPRTDFPPMSDAARLRTQVPLNLQPAAGEEPIRDMLSSLLQELGGEESGQGTESKLKSKMESAAESKRSKYRSTDEVARIQQLLKQAGGTQ